MVRQTKTHETEMGFRVRVRVRVSDRVRVSVRVRVRVCLDLGQVGVALAVEVVHVDPEGPSIGYVEQGPLVGAAVTWLGFGLGARTRARG